MSFSPVETLTFYPESYLPNAIYIPHHFGPELASITGDEVTLESDSEGIISTIHLVNPETDEYIFPFIDLSMYDSSSKSWKWYDNDGLFYRFINGTLENLYPSNYSSLTGDGSVNFDPRSESLSGIFNGKGPNGESSYAMYKYAPIILTINKEAIVDVTDYSYMRTSDRLSSLNTDVREFYYDFRGRIFTNQNLGELSASSIKLYYYKVSDNSAKVKCRMAGGYGSPSTFTPVVHDFVFKMNAQNLRS